MSLALEELEGPFVQVERDEEGRILGVQADAAALHQVKEKILGKLERTLSAGRKHRHCARGQPDRGGVAQRPGVPCAGAAGLYRLGGGWNSNGTALRGG